MFEESPLHGVRSLDILTALFDRGADPILLSDLNISSLMSHATYAPVECLPRMLQDARVPINLQNMHRNTALHYACKNLQNMYRNGALHYACKFVCITLTKDTSFRRFVFSSELAPTHY